DRINIQCGGSATHFGRLEAGPGVPDPALLLFCFAGALFLDRGLRGGGPRNRNAEGRAAHIWEPDAVAELHGVGIPAMFPADAELEVLAHARSLLDGHLHELTDASLIDR